MLRHNLSFRILGPTLLVSLILLGFCVAAGLYLFNEQAATAAALGEDVSSVQVAHDIENTLNALAALLRDGNERVGPLHDRLREQLDQAWDQADKPEERDLVRRLDASVARYLERWERRDRSAALRTLQQ